MCGALGASSVLRAQGFPQVPGGPRFRACWECERKGPGDPMWGVGWVRSGHAQAPWWPRWSQCSEHQLVPSYKFGVCVQGVGPGATARPGKKKGLLGRWGDHHRGCRRAPRRLWGPTWLLPLQFLPSLCSQHFCPCLVLTVCRPPLGTRCLLLGCRQ